MRAALARGDRVHFVDDDGRHARQRLPRLRREHEVQRLWSRDEDVWRVAQLLPALRRTRVTRAHAHADVRRYSPESPRCLRDADEGRVQVPLDVDAKRFEWRQVHDSRATLRARFLALRATLGGQLVDRPEEGAQRLARARRRHDQGVVPIGDLAPRRLLHGRRADEGAAEPLPCGGGERVERGRFRHEDNRTTHHRHQPSGGRDQPPEGRAFSRHERSWMHHVLKE